ncbi:MarR family transcriptional regulator [Streptomyces sp. NPDC005227]|uniref:MarR family transcriptional regulator n=1 Tax=Streptomyces sp. NPDC005227 TaxID=3364707 RepID=UPI0036CDA6CA
MHEQAGRWDFLTNYARVLFAIAHHTAPRLRDIAAACDITERTAQNIVTDLEHAGYLRRQREGRRTRYTLNLNSTLRHPADAHVPIADLVNLFAPHHRPAQTAGTVDSNDRTADEPRPMADRDAS